METKTQLREMLKKARGGGGGSLHEQHKIASNIACKNLHRSRSCACHAHKSPVTCHTGAASNRLLFGRRGSTSRLTTGVRGMKEEGKMRDDSGDGLFLLFPWCCCGWRCCCCFPRSLDSPKQSIFCSLVFFFFLHWLRGPYGIHAKSRLYIHEIMVLPSFEPLSLGLFSVSP